MIFVSIISAGAHQADPVRGEGSIWQRQSESRHRQVGRTTADPVGDESPPGGSRHYRDGVCRCRGRGPETTGAL